VCRPRIMKAMTIRLRASTESRISMLKAIERPLQGTGRADHLGEASSAPLTSTGSA
jgi:hypothetical protein